jgi:DNA-binding NarL/FixJ family response regulator
VRTVESHLSNIYDKVGAQGKVARTVAVAYGLRHGLL